LHAWPAWRQARPTWSRYRSRLPEILSGQGLEDLGATAESALYRGGSPWAEYWRQTVAELRTRLEDSGLLAARSIDGFLARCADPAWWTQTIAFTAVHGRKPSI
jgi:hypothetical protein